MLQSNGVQFRTEKLRASQSELVCQLSPSTDADLHPVSKEIFQYEASIITNANHISEPQIVTSVLLRSLSAACSRKHLHRRPSRFKSFCSAGQRS
jgi:hypothetical protein